jgi:hypothetical protein
MSVIGLMLFHIQQLHTSYFIKRVSLNGLKLNLHNWNTEIRNISVLNTFPNPSLDALLHSFIS